MLKWGNLYKIKNIDFTYVQNFEMEGRPSRKALADVMSCFSSGPRGGRRGRGQREREPEWKRGDARL